MAALTWISAIYCDSIAGTFLWYESHIGVPVINGQFNVTLGEIDPMTADVFSGPVDSGEYSLRWLEIKVEGETILPRTQEISEVLPRVVS